MAALVAPGRTADPARRASGAGRIAAFARPAAVAVAAATTFAYVGAVDPNHPGHYPTCPFRAVTGLYCPGCGSLRALHALAHGDLLGALARNPLMVAAVPVLAWWWVRWVQRIARGAPRPRPAPPAVLYGVLAVVLVFWVVRNLPFGGALAP